MARTDLTTFEFPTTGYQLRVFEVDGEHRFHATDVATMLGYSVAKDMTRGLSDDEKGGHNVPTLGGSQTITLITEPGLYHALGNRRPGAIKDPEIRAQVEAFQRWIYHDVIPAIRNTGTYSLAPQTPAPAAVEPSRKELARMVIESEEAREEAEQRAMFAEGAVEVLNTRVKEYLPKVEHYDAWIDVPLTMNLDDAAKHLAGHPVLVAAGVRTGPFLLRDTLKEWKWIYRPTGKFHGKNKDLRPHMNKINDGTFTLPPAGQFKHPRTGEMIAKEPQILVTRKGLERIYNRLLNEAPARLFD